MVQEMPGPVHDRKPDYRLVPGGRRTRSFRQWGVQVAVRLAADLGLAGQLAMV